MDFDKIEEKLDRIAFALEVIATKLDPTWLTDRDHPVQQLSNKRELTRLEVELSLLEPSKDPWGD